MKNSKAICATIIITAMLVIICACLYKLLPIVFQIVAGLLACLGIAHGSLDLASWLTSDGTEKDGESLEPIPVVMGDEVPDGIPETVDDIMREVKYGSA